MKVIRIDRWVIANVENQKQFLLQKTSTASLKNKLEQLNLIQMIPKLKPSTGSKVESH